MPLIIAEKVFPDLHPDPLLHAASKYEQLSCLKD
jgi:hypothetical protein